MSARLTPLSGGAAPTIALQQQVLLIGRHPECDIRIDLPEISRRHCCVAPVDDRVMIRDLGSRNGVRVNGRLVEEARLHVGDEVAIAHLLYRFEDLTAVKPPPSPAPLAGRRPAPTVAPQSAPPSDRDDDPDNDLIPLDDD